ncbi:YhbY family RNA-binding protein [Rhodocyclus tenuis]|uniref:Ribosome assembly RNA-binding protein YhbY n=2 Tax=Rhodocyclus TaxID=1064 RepID=A0A6L5JVU9_RHOTE|nr:YhbY family RNA-binding protein [Rhodocyclus gracilis]MQY51171.1 ribosome assembly RNA-binding protein YhbY [Rhodocyclus gracilis]NJA88880.1 YhbY family RNA-binding protein [Rhodocyclus gracilis]
MPTLTLSTDQRRGLRARAHALKPVVSISQNGLSEAVLKEIGVALHSHQLIKIRVYNDDREKRERFLAAICEEHSAAPVQHIGKLLVVWRPGADEDDAAAKRVRPGRRAPRRPKRSFQNEG